VVSSKIDHSSELVDQIGWNFGFNIPNFSSLDQKTKMGYIKIVSIYEQQSHSFLTKTWTESEFYASSSVPSTSTTFSPKSNQSSLNSLKDVFDPSVTTKDGLPFWVVDFASSNIDSSGWIYGGTFTDIDKGNGKSSGDGFLFHLVRRRIWKRNNQVRENVK
jgi:hypothetical protein